VLSLRDFIYRELSTKITAKLVLAENATKVFELSGYRDLVAFEKDIARISSLVALVSETPGSLAELGAFSQIPEIAKVLYVIVQESLHGESQSFIRLGPFLALENLDSERDPVGDFVWRTRRDKSVIRSSVAAQSADLAASINERSIGGYENLDVTNTSHVMIMIHWICHMIRGARLVEIRTYLAIWGMPIEQGVLKRYIYCLRVAGWLAEKNVGSSYFYPVVDIDVVDYAFRDGVVDKSPVRRKVAISAEVERQAKRPRAVSERIGTDG